MKLTPELVLAQWAAGMAVALFVVTRWKVTSAGYAWLCGLCSAALAIFAWAAGGQATWLLLVAAACSTVGVIASMAKQRAVESVFEGVAAAAGLGAVTAIAVGTAGTVAVPMAVLRALSGAVFLGFVTDSMALGHWYLIDPKLPKAAIRRLNLGAAATLGAYVFLVALPPASILGELNGQLLEVLAWLALCVFCAVLVFLVSRALNEKGYASVMAATGLLYVATMVAFGAVVVGLLPTST